MFHTSGPLQLENIHSRILHPTGLLKSYTFGKVAGASVNKWICRTTEYRTNTSWCSLGCRIAPSPSNSAHLPWGVSSALGTPATSQVQIPLLSFKSARSLPTGWLYFCGSEKKAKPPDLVNSLSSSSLADLSPSLSSPPLPVFKVTIISGLDDTNTCPMPVFHTVAR